mgnify:CR=1 FL=1
MNDIDLMANQLATFLLGAGVAMLGGTCPVADTIVHVSNTPGSLIPALATARDTLKSLVLAEPGNPTWKVTSEYRSISYQQHFYSLRTTFIALNALPGIESYVLQIGTKERPQLKILEGSEFTTCSALVTKLNDEIRLHGLKVGPAGPPDYYAPPVSEPSKAENAAHTQGRAFDATIGNLTAARIDELANLAGLHRPYLPHDDVHFELKPPTAP